MAHDNCLPISFMVVKVELLPHCWLCCAAVLMGGVVVLGFGQSRRKLVCLRAKVAKHIA